jgi:RimJ/RimL family protein N-acetyltransferase
MTVAPVTLRGRFVRLEPLGLAHLPGLCRIGLDPALWTWIPTPVETPEEMEHYVRTALEEREQGVAQPFAILREDTDEVIGSTRYAAIDPHNRHLEIGWTFVARSHQRTAANTEAKLLLLTHAFETLAALRVEFKTDVLNEASRRALLRLGAVEEGTFRKHRITASGRVRDTVYFSVIDTEWPLVRERLQGFLAR